jgi:endoglucanase
VTLSLVVWSGSLDRIGRTSSTAPSGAQAEALTFLDRYVADDGRVVRRDQGGDTVSEGQAYALLLAVAARDDARFARIWQWTESHLQRPDGLLAWHWANGQVVDDMPATDADLDAARALTLAGSVFDQPGYRTDAARIADAILSEETVTVGGAHLQLVAGPWARGAPGSTVAGVVNPSYFSPRAYTQLAEATGDPRWTNLRDSSLATVDALSARSLPPDWATIDTNGEVHPVSSPSGNPPGYGQDAARVPLRFAEDCGADARAHAARMWSRLQYERHRSTLGFVAAAAAADAAGDIHARDTLLARADAAERSSPTYYGAAWTALGRVMLTTSLLGSCP